MPGRRLTEYGELQVDAGPQEIEVLRSHGATYYAFTLLPVHCEKTTANLVVITKLV